jgi:hypothetical protein
MDTPTGHFKRDAIRVSDAERDQAVAELSKHYQSGRLTLEEFDDRSDRALRAKTGSDLSALFTDLPTGTATGPAPEPAGPGLPSFPAGPVQRHPGGPSVARIVIAFVIASIILGNLASVAVNSGHVHVHVGWLLPVVVLGLVFLRLCRRR